jgi:hypothetical protein
VALLALGAGAARLNAAAPVTPPPVPEVLEVEAGNVPYLILHAVGTQNQVCQPRPSGVGLGWAFFGPQATLFDADGRQQVTHYLSANPIENGAARATWQHSGDTSSVWAAATAVYSEPDYVAAGAIPWLKLKTVGAVDGPAGGYKVSDTTFIQRVNTVGGIAPATDCPAIGAKLLVPYEADYVFYKAK